MTTQITTQQQQSIFDFISEPNTPVVPVQKIKTPKKVKKTYLKPTNVFCLETETCVLSEIIKNSKVVVKTDYKNATSSLPDHHLLLCDGFDGKKDMLTFNWSEDDISKLWMGMLTEYFSLLNYAKEMSTDRHDILHWMSTDSFDIVCAHLNLNPNDLRIGLFQALDNKDTERKLDTINNGILTFDRSVKSMMLDLQITTKTLNSRFNINKLSNSLISRIAKCKQDKRKQEFIDDVNSQEFKNYCKSINLNGSAVINKVNATLGKINTGELEGINSDFGKQHYNSHSLEDFIF